MAGVSKTKALKRLAQMPRLHHTLPGQEFDAQKSEVLKWISEQLVLIESIMQLGNRKGAIIYDKETGEWRGKDTA